MPRRSTRLPAYRHFKPRDLAVVRINGKDHYLGKYNSPESWEKYWRLINEWRSGELDLEKLREQLPKESPRINCLIEAFFGFCQQYYRKGDQLSKEFYDFRYSLEPLSELFGLTSASEFGPKCLKALQQHLIDKGWSRGVINQRINRVRRMFKWAVEEELVSPSVLHGLQAVSGLKYGRTAARETEPVKPVADSVVEATLPYLAPPVAAMVRLQRLTGARPCEVLLMRKCDIDRSEEIWTFEPADHKNRWRGHQRLIPLGPQAQEILTSFFNRDDDAFLFSPIEAEQYRNEVRRQNRKSPMTPSQAARKRKARPKRPKRDRYDRHSYWRAIDYAVKQANKNRKEAQPEIPNWCPLQLRHTRATEVRRQFGLDGAQSALGHKNANVTQVYAERNLELAVRIAKETG